MASTQLFTKKDGGRYYRIRVSRGRGKQPYSMNWDVPDGWAAKSIERELVKVAAEFERACKAGEVKTREELKAEEEQKRAELAKIKTLKEYGEKVYMPDLETTCAENTRYNFQCCLNTHIYPVLGNIKITEIEPAQITALLLSLQREKQLSHSSVLKAYTILNLIFKKAYLARMVMPNPMDFVERPKPMKSEGKDSTMEFYNEQELQYILSCLDKEPLKWRAYCRILIDTACRRGEALGLRWSCFDYDKAEIRIERSLNYNNEKGIYSETPKSGKTRTIAISKETADLLKQIQDQQKEMKKNKKVVPLDGWIFTAENIDEPMHPTSPTHYFRQFGIRYHVDHFHPHKLRHTAISQMLLHGIDVKTISEIAGHADATMVLKVYSHSDFEAQKKALELYRREVLKEKRA